MAFDPNDPADKAIVAQMVKTAVEKETAGLINKRDELLGEVKALKGFKGTAAELEAKLAEIENERLLKEGKFEELLNSTKADYANKQAELNAKLEAKQKAVEKLLIDNGLKSALVGVNVKKEFLKAAELMLKEQVSVVDQDGNLVAMAGDKSLTDFVKAWAASDEGSAFVLAPNNSGGSAPGGTNNSDNRSKVSEFSMGELSSIKKENPDRYKAIIANK